MEGGGGLSWDLVGIMPLFLTIVTHPFAHVELRTRALYCGGGDYSCLASMYSESVLLGFIGNDILDIFFLQQSPWPGRATT